MIDLKYAEQKFKNHEAKLMDYGNVKILDFKNPKSIIYRIRFMFEQDYHRLHISGDLGELIATNHNNMVFEKFEDFVYDPEYFEEKIDCCSRKLYRYSEDKARKDLLELIDSRDLRDEIAKDEMTTLEKDEYINEWIKEIVEDLDYETGIGSLGYEKLSDVDMDVFEYCNDIGKERTGIIELYLHAFKLAMERLPEASK